MYLQEQYIHSQDIRATQGVADGCSCAPEGVTVFRSRHAALPHGRTSTGRDQYIRLYRQLCGMRARAQHRPCRSDGAIVSVQARETEKQVRTPATSPREHSPGPYRYVPRWDLRCRAARRCAAMQALQLLSSLPEPSCYVTNPPHNSCRSRFKLTPGCVASPLHAVLGDNLFHTARTHATAFPPAALLSQ